VDLVKKNRSKKMKEIKKSPKILKNILKNLFLTLSWIVWFCKFSIVWLALILEVVEEQGTGTLW